MRAEGLGQRNALVDGPPTELRKFDHGDGLCIPLHDNFRSLLNFLQHGREVRRHLGLRHVELRHTFNYRRSLVLDPTNQRPWRAS